MVRKEYSMAGAWLLSLSVAAAMALSGQVNWLAVYGQAGAVTGREAAAAPFQTAMAVMLIPGAFLAALPGRLRRRGQPHRRSTCRGCLRCFVGGVILMLSAGLAGMGDGLLMAGLAQGNLSAYAFAACAWIVGLAVLRLTGGRRAE